VGAGVGRGVGFEVVRSLTYGEMRKMQLAADAGGSETPSLRSFGSGDVVIEATDEDGATH